MQHSVNLVIGLLIFICALAPGACAGGPIDKAEVGFRLGESLVETTSLRGNLLSDWGHALGSGNRPEIATIQRGS